MLYSPITSPYFNEKIFHDLNEDINNFSNSQSPLLLCGDLNSKTGNIPDFISNAKDGNSLTDQITTQIDTYRRNFDSEVNSYGQNLLELCKGNNHRIINGRCFRDSFGKYTFFSSDNKKSTVDYSIVSDHFFENISSFLVKPLSYLSDHCQAVTNINAQTQQL